MNDLKSRLTSRKLWLSIAAFITFVANKQYPEAMGVIIAYVSAQGVAEAAGRISNK